MNEENIPQSFKMSYILHRPWSDILFETTLPPTVLEKILEISDEIQNQQVSRLYQLKKDRDNSNVQKKLKLFLVIIFQKQIYYIQIGFMMLIYLKMIF